MILATPHRTAREAIDGKEDGQTVVSMDGVFWTMTKEDAEDLEADGAIDAYWFRVPFDGHGATRIVSVPVGRDDE